jgi:hypothetical protein
VRPYADAARAQPQLVRSAGNGAHSRDDTRVTRAGGKRGGIDTRLYYAPDGHRKFASKIRQSEGRCGIAGDHDCLGAMSDKKCGDFTGETADHGRRLSSVGNPRCVSQIKKILVRHRCPESLQDRQSAYSGIKHADHA